MQALNKLRWPALRDRLRTSLWLTPVTYTVMAGLLAMGLLQLDHRLTANGPAWYFYGGQAEGARALLSTIASSMLTIAGLVFSITILVLQLASSQFSPRVLRTFLQDTVTQRAMGTFLGSFVYAMVLLPEVRSKTDDTPAFVPRLSVYVAFVLVLIGVSFFVRYIHHMAHSIRAVNIMKRVARETRASLERLYPEAFLDEPEQEPAVPSTAPSVTLVNHGDGGVVISVNEDALMTTARERDLTVELLPQVGMFVPHGAPLCRIWSRDAPTDLNVSEWVVLADERTPHQDPIFGFRQLVDVAERALSPGINDPTTASQALDYLHDLLRSLATRRIPSTVRVDGDGRVRLVLPRPDWADYVRLSFEEIRHYGAGSIQVVRRARSALVDLLSVVPGARAAAVEHELAQLDSAAQDALPGPSR